MENIIKKLVEIDAESAAKVAAAKEKKRNARLQVNAKKDQIYQQFLESQKAELKQHQQQLEQETANNEKAQATKYTQTLQKMADLYQENKDQWVDDIVTRCLQ